MTTRPSRDPDSDEWKAAMKRASESIVRTDDSLMAEAFEEMADELRETSKHLKGYWVHSCGAAASDRFGVAAFSPAHAARLVRTYVFPFVRSPEPFQITELEPARKFFQVDIWHPELPRENENGVSLEGYLPMPWARPKGDEIEPLLDILVEEGFTFIDIPGMKELHGDALFDDPNFVGRKQPTGCLKIAFVLSSPSEDISASISWYASKMVGPLDEEFDDDENEYAFIEPRLVVLDVPLPEKCAVHACPHKYNVW